MTLETTGGVLIALVRPASYSSSRMVIKPSKAIPILITSIVMTVDLMERALTTFRMVSRTLFRTISVCHDASCPVLASTWKSLVIIPPAR